MTEKFIKALARHEIAQQEVNRLNSAIGAAIGADMKERPILFSAPMVRAILEGRKTQTRRVVKPPKWSDADEIFFIGNDSIAVPDDDHADYFIACPYGQPGDRLWVRETFADEAGGTRRFLGEHIFYRADDWQPLVDRWTPSIHMPRWASRITLEVTAVSVERLQDISESDCCAEGCGSPITRDLKKPQFMALWESINGPDSWDANPWVWVVEFKVLNP